MGNCFGSSSTPTAKWRSYEEGGDRPRAITRAPSLFAVSQSYRGGGEGVERQPSWGTDASSQYYLSLIQSEREQRGVERQPSTRAGSFSRPQLGFLERQGSALRAEASPRPLDRRSQLIKKYSYIPDHYTSLDQDYKSIHQGRHQPAPPANADMGNLVGSLVRWRRRSPTSRETGRESRYSSLPSINRPSLDRRMSQLTKKYAFIPDNYTTVDQVTAALREAGLESSNLIVGIDFTKSNEWTGKHSFNGQSLHKISGQPNPYEQAISIIGKVLAPFDEDNLIPCFGFGDSTTHDKHVFSFHTDHSPCHGFDEVLACYRKIVPHLRLAGPTSFAPIVEAAVDIVERSHGQYHVLVIIADGQVTRSVETDDGDLSPQERMTIDSIVMASAYPLSIVLVGVGDGPWDNMKKFDDKIPARDFDNFQFVNFTAIMGRNTSSAEKEAAFALAALMEVPIQYKATVELGILGRTTGKAKRVVPLPPPLPAPQRKRSLRPSQSRSQSSDEQGQVCPICLTNEKDLAFGCGHTCCKDCGQSLTRCPICRTVITSRLRLYTG